MGKITEIIKSGVAPGIRAGRPAVDPDSVFAKVPKALREIERGERRSKRGTDAKDISRLFGMSTSTIKAAWNIGCVLALFLTQCGAFGGDLQPGETFTDGQTVHASDLNNAIGGATLNSGSPNFISRQQTLTPNVAADYFIGYNPSVPGLYKATLVSMLQNTYAFQSLTQGTPIYTNQDLFQFYSASNTNLLESINPSNLVLFVAQNINLPLWANLNLAPTNNNTGATNLPVLANWPYTFSGAQTNNQPFF